MFAKTGLSVNCLHKFSKFASKSFSSPFEEIINQPWIAATKSKIHTSTSVSSGVQQASCAAKGFTIISEEENQEFRDVYPQLVNDIVEAGKETRDPVLCKHLEDMYHYNVGGGTNFRGLMLAKAYKMMEKPENLTPENIKLANIMGWFVEMSGGSVAISDDIVDGSVIRRGKPCWHLKKEVGLNSINDFTLIESGIYHLMTKYFEHRPYYIPAMKLFHEITLKTYIGQIMDTMPTIRGTKNLNIFSLDTYVTTMKMKTSYCVFHLGMAVAMHMANINDPVLHENSKRIMMDMGIYYQLYNDYLDCYGTMDRSGKRGNDDIRSKKVTWFSCAAVESANSKQKEIFAKNYGIDNDDAVAEIHNLYSALKLKDKFHQYQEDTITRIKNEIRKLPNEVNPHQLLVDHLEEIVAIDPL